MIRRGWCLGSAESKDNLLERMDGRLGEHHGGELKRERAQAKAQRIIAGELKARNWGERDLKVRIKRDPEKPAMAARLRRETTLELPLIAAWFRMERLETLRSQTASLEKRLGHPKYSQDSSLIPFLPSLGRLGAPALNQPNRIQSQAGVGEMLVQSALLPDK